jgi:hypothetical protein
MFALNPLGCTLLFALVGCLGASANDGVCSSSIEIFVPHDPEDRWQGLIIQDWLREYDFNHTWVDAPDVTFAGENYKLFEYAQFFGRDHPKYFRFYNGPENDRRMTRVSTLRHCILAQIYAVQMSDY